MASVSDIRDGLATRLQTITALRVHRTIPDSINPPAAVIGSPDIVFDKTFGRGSDAVTIPVRVYACRSSERAGQENLDEYLNGSGAKSIKAAVEGGATNTLGGSVDFAVVTRVNGYGVYSIGGVDYLGAEFSVSISAPGG